MRSKWTAALAGAVLIAAWPGRAEDCVSFNPANVTVKAVNGTYKVADGLHYLMDFGTSLANATRARDIIKHYGLSKQCWVGRPDPGMHYFRTPTGFPSGPFPGGEDVIRFNPYNVKAVSVGGRWKVADCGVYLMDFGSASTAQSEALTAVSLIKANSLRTMGFVGRPNPPMTYFLTDPAFRPEVSLAVTLRPQLTGMWCWAASGRMAMEFLGTPVAQCTQANNRFDRTDCCNIQGCPNPETDHGCVQGGWPEFDKYGFSSDITDNAALSWDALWNQVNCKRKPVAFSWKWDGGGGHMMVIRGLRIASDGTRMVQINNPWAPCTGDTQWITYANYIQQEGDHTHWNDYYNITRGGT